MLCHQARGTYSGCRPIVELRDITSDEDVFAVVRGRIDVELDHDEPINTAALVFKVAMICSRRTLWGCR